MALLEILLGSGALAVIGGTVVTVAAAVSGVVIYK